MRDFSGFYRGTVLNVLDPLKAGRIKVKVHGVYDNIPEEAIPWALYADPLMGGVASVGGFFIPNVDEEVWVFFEEGNFMMPVFFAGAPSALGRVDEKDAEEGEYSKNRSFKTSQGHVIEFDDTEGSTRIRLHHKSGTEILMLDNGDLQETVIGNVTRIVEGDVTVTIKGDYKTDVVGQCDLKSGATMNIDGSVINLG